MKGRVLIVAGSDSGGGAGIQADIKTVTALGGFAMTAVTALTAQNSLGVHGVHAVPTEFIAQQIEVVLDDLGADCIKTGMLHTSEVIECVINTLDRHGANIPLIADPVMVAKGGAALLVDDAVATLKAEVLPRAALITPNLPEAEALTGRTIETPDDMRMAADDLLAVGPKAVLIKGGHLQRPTLVDILVTADGVEERFEGPRIETRHTHGTGCTLASAIAAGVAQGMELSPAITRAREYVVEAIRRAPGFGAGHGPLDHGHTFAAKQ